MSRPSLGGQAASVHCIAVRVFQRYAGEVLLVVRQGKPGSPIYQGQRFRHGRAQLVHQCGNLTRVGRAMESAHADAHRMHRAAAEQLDQLVAQRLEAQPPAHGIGVHAGQSDHAVRSQEIRGGEQMDVQRMTLDPFAAVHGSAQILHPGAHLNAEGALQGLHRAHLVGDRTDAADARNNVGDLGVAAALQQLLEQARGFVDAQLELADGARKNRHVERTFAFHAREHGHADLDLPCVSHASPPWRRGRRREMRARRCR